MKTKQIDRRAFLMSSAGLGGLLALVAGTRAASAFTVENYTAQSKLAMAVANRCSEDALHAQIMAKLEQDLANRTGLSGTSVSETQYCPFCGCPITATRILG